MRNGCRNCATKAISSNAEIIAPKPAGMALTKTWRENPPQISEHSHRLFVGTSEIFSSFNIFAGS